MTINEYKDAIRIIELLCNVEILHWYVKTNLGYIDIVSI